MDYFSKNSRSPSSSKTRRHQKFGHILRGKGGTTVPFPAIDLRAVFAIGPVLHCLVVQQQSRVLRAAVSALVSETLPNKSWDFREKVVRCIQYTCYLLSTVQGGSTFCHENRKSLINGQQADGTFQMGHKLLNYPVYFTSTSRSGQSTLGKILNYFKETCLISRENVRTLKANLS